MSYIAFLDLLGIKAIATYDSEKYFEQINCFQNAIIGIASEKSVAKIKVQSFSDCAYIECDDLKHLFMFLINLRENLSIEQIFFNAAVTEGKLLCENKIIKNGRNAVGSCVSFNSVDTIHVYTKQVNFSGIGILVADKIVDKLNSDLSNLIVKSAYCPYDINGEYKSFRAYYDLKYPNMTVELFSFLIKNYIQTIILDKRAARYYISAIISCVNAMSWDEMNELYIECFLNIQKSFQHKGFLEELLPIHLVFINRLFSIYHFSLNSETDYANFDKKLLSIVNSSFLKHNLKNISEYSDYLITSKNKYLLSKHINKI